MKLLLLISRMVGLALVLVFCAVSNLQAQAALPASKTNPFTPTIPDGPPGAHSHVDYTTLNAEAWTLLCESHAAQLKSKDPVRKDIALQNVIFFATHYPGKVRYQPAMAALYGIYRFDDSEAYRIMALAALHAIGDEAVMQQLYQDVQREKSPRVRALTKAALANHRSAKNRSLASAQK